MPLWSSGRERRERAVTTAVGRMRRLTVVGLAGAAFAGRAPPASAANDVWLWTCHGPAGEGLHAGPLLDGDGAVARPFAGSASGHAGLAAFGAGCAGGEAGGLTGRFARAGEAGTHPAAAPPAEGGVFVPPGLPPTPPALPRAAPRLRREPPPGDPPPHAPAAPPPPP